MMENFKCTQGWRMPLSYHVWKQLPQVDLNLLWRKADAVVSPKSPTSQPVPPWLPWFSKAMAIFSCLGRHSVVGWWVDKFQWFFSGGSSAKGRVSKGHNHFKFLMRVEWVHGGMIVSFSGILSEFIGLHIRSRGNRTNSICYSRNQFLH